MKKCNKCNTIKELSCFNKNKSESSGLQHFCKCCMKEYQELNKHKYKDRYIGRYYSKKYAKEYYQTVTKNKRKVRLQTDSLYALTQRVRSRMNTALVRFKFGKDGRTEEILDCTFNELTKYLENLFLENMTWENRHLWHVDHIIPLASAKTQEEIIKLFHYTNLQPLWAFDNLSKGSKI